MAIQSGYTKAAADNWERTFGKEDEGSKCTSCERDDCICPNPCSYILSSDKTDVCRTCHGTHKCPSCC